MADESFVEVVELLRKKRDYHRQHLDKIEKMLEIAVQEAEVESRRGDLSTENRFAAKTNIPWTSHIREIFSQADTALDRVQVQERLIDAGVADRQTIAKSYNTIVGIVSRLVAHKELVRSEDGTLRRGPNHPQEKSDKVLEMFG